MKRFITAALLLAASVTAEATRTHAAEPPRRPLRPYVSFDEAAADTPSLTDGKVRRASAYISPVTEFVRAENDGQTSFGSTFVYPAAWLNRQLLLRIGSASAGYTIFVNGTEAGRATNGAQPAEFNVTKLSHQGINELTVVLDTPGSGKPLLETGAEWLGAAEVIAQPTIRLRDVDIRTSLNEQGDAVVQVSLAVKTDALNPKRSRMTFELTAPDSSRLAHGVRDVELNMRGEDTVGFTAVVPRKWLWSVDSPSLLTLTVTNRTGGRTAETVVLPIGAREAVYDDDEGLRVNGATTALKVAEVSGSVSTDELLRLKGRGYNAVTTVPGEAPQTLYDACDAAGMYVIAQTAVDTSHGSRSIRRNGNAANDPRFTEEYLSRTQAAYHVAKSHPSVVAFSTGRGVTNGINPYESYLWIKSTGDTRPVIYDAAGGEWNNDDIEISFPR